MDEYQRILILAGQISYEFNFYDYSVVVVAVNDNIFQCNYFPAYLCTKLM